MQQESKYTTSKRTDANPTEEKKNTTAKVQQEKIHLQPA